MPGCLQQGQAGDGGQNLTTIERNAEREQANRKRRDGVTRKSIP